jgi:hypothetical protein
VVRRLAALQLVPVQQPPALPEQEQPEQEYL